jgi:N6-adenosine-specific RNA methylase IME4
MRYRAILADPPWHFSTWSARGRDRCPDAPVYNAQGFDVRGRNNSPLRHYSTLPLADIMAMPVEDAAADDCVLFLWTVDPLLPRAIEVGAAWGFTYKTVGFVWAKERRNRGANNSRPHVKSRPFPMGTGYWTRANPEICLLFTRGKPKRLCAGVEKLIVAPRREHSRKPDETYERIEQLVAGPYLELFARSSRDGWDQLGDQVGRWTAPDRPHVPDPQMGLSL